MSQRILVVDDEPPILDVLREALDGAGFEVQTACSAVEALGCIREQLYDVAILDFALPDMTGVMLHHEIRRMDPELAGRTLFISGQEQSEDTMSYFDSFAAGFIGKPFDLAEVVTAVRRLLTPDPP